MCCKVYAIKPILVGVESWECLLLCMKNRPNLVELIVPVRYES